jgi:cytosolic iron-sulfur protein assembly protein CIAO1
LENAHNGIVWSGAFHGSGDLLATCGQDKSIRLWRRQRQSGSDDELRWHCVEKLKDVHKRTVRRVAWRYDTSELYQDRQQLEDDDEKEKLVPRDLLAACSFDGITSIWERQIIEQNESDDEQNEGKKVGFVCVATLEGHESEVKSVSWGGNNDARAMLATCSRDKSVWIWEMVDESSLEFECVAVMHGHSGDVKQAVWNRLERDSPQLVSCSYDDTIRVWQEDDDDDYLCVDTLKEHDSTVWEVAMHANVDDKGCQRMASVGDTTLRFWTRAPSGRWKHQATLSGHFKRAPLSVDWQRCAPHRVAVGDSSNDLHIFEERDDGTFERIAHVIGAHKTDVNVVRFHPTDPTILFTGSDDGAIKFWSLS